jgi:hypothetical protein
MPAKSLSSKACLLGATLLSGSHAMAAPDPITVYGVGQGALGRSFYNIDLGAGTSTVFRSLAADPSPADANSPNGVGYDE